MINKEMLEKYADLKIKEKAIKAELDLLNPEITKQVSEYISANDGQLPGLQGLGTFRVDRRKTWKYSSAVETVKESLEALKEEEEATGIATYTEKESLVFNQDK